MSWLDSRMVHGSMTNDSRVADKVYMKRGCWRWRSYFSTLFTCSLV